MPMRNFDLAVVTLIVVVLLTGCGHSEGEAPAEMPVDSASTPSAGAVLSEIPEILDPSARYLIYLHGLIVEEQGMQATHPKYGTYHYAEILQAFADRGFTVISEARPSGARPDVFADRLIDQVQQLLDGGVPEDHVTVVGFSKGGIIALIASRTVARDQVNWVIQAGCGRWLGRLQGLVPTGRLLSQIDQGDEAALSCAALFARMPEDAIFEEQTLELGLGHGAFYSLDPAWFEKAVEWAGK